MSKQRSAGKKLVFICPTGDLNVGGEISHYELILDAIYRGFTVHAVVPYRASLADQLSKKGANVHVVEYSHWNPETPIEKYWKKDFNAIASISQIVKKHNIDILITNTLNMPWGALAAAVTERCHIWIAREHPQYDWEYLNERLKFIADFSSIVMANSKELSRLLIKLEPQMKTGYFFSYVNEKGIDINTSIKATRLICIGGIYHWKNQIFLIYMLAKLKKNYDQTPDLILIGSIKSEKYWQEIKKLAKKLDVDKQIKHFKYAEEPFSLVGPNDIFIQPSKMESIGRVVTEAMKLGLVCVGADISGTKEAFSLGGGELYEQENPDSAASAINTILENLSRYKQKAKKHQINAIKNLDKQSCHNPFFHQLSELSAANMPDLRFIFPYLSEMGTLLKKVDQLEFQSKALKPLKKENELMRDQLNRIYGSRWWKLVQKADKLKRRIKR